MKNKRYQVVEARYLTDAWCVDDTYTHKTKAIFYDEAAESLAIDFCRQMNIANDKKNGKKGVAR